MSRRRKQHRHRERRYHRHIEQNGRCRCRCEARQRVENAAVKRHQGHEQKIGECDPRELDSERKTAGIFGEARGKKRNHRRCEDQCKQNQKADAAEKDGKYAIGEELCRTGPALFADACIGGDESCVECAFGEDRAEMIRKPQRDKEGIRDRPRSEHGRQHHVAEKARDPR